MLFVPLAAIILSEFVFACFFQPNILDLYICFLLPAWYSIYTNWQDIKLDNLETSHFVLVHGGGFGAWCWYKTIALLEEGGYKVTAVDLTGSGIHSFDTNSITSLSQYVKPLTEFLEKLTDGEKVTFTVVPFNDLPCEPFLQHVAFSIKFWKLRMSGMFFSWKIFLLSFNIYWWIVLYMWILVWAVYRFCIHVHFKVWNCFSNFIIRYIFL